MIKLKARSEDLLLSVDVDRVAWTTEGHLAMISFVATESTAKSVIAMLQACKRSSCFEGASASQFRMVLSPLGYRIAKSKLGRFNAVHVVAVARIDGLIFGDLHESLSDFILSSQITTPVLKQWIPYLVDQLQEGQMIDQLHCYEISAYQCQFDSQALDEIVSKAVCDQSLSIPVRNPEHAS